MTKQQLEKVIAGQKRKMHKMGKILARWERRCARLENEIVRRVRADMDLPPERERNSCEVPKP